MLGLFSVHVFIFSAFCVYVMQSHPIHKRNEYDISQDTNVEMKLPNGTIVGKYNYTDNDGNPIEVKYFADDSSYGVELKSVKTKMLQSKQPKYSSGTLSNFNDSHILMRETSSIEKHVKPRNYQKTEYATPNSEYEIFSQKEMKAPKVCANEKVRIYLNTDKRSARHVDEEHSGQMRKYGEEYLDEMAKYCQQIV